MSDRRSTIPALLILLLTGCGSDKYCKIESDTSWGGWFASVYHEGNGNARIDLSNDGEQCVSVVKSDTAGTFLTIQLVKDSYFFLAPSRDNKKKTTTEPHGKLEDCIE